jgi:hypothetical protein
MTEKRLRLLLNRLRAGRIDIEQALAALRLLPFEDLEFAKIDHHRALRKGLGEVVYCEGKTPEQTAQIVSRLRAHNPVVLATRATLEHFEAVKRAVRDAAYHEAARMIVAGKPVRSGRRRGKEVVVVSAGTADQPVAEEAALTAEAMGATVDRIYDVGVSGVHRLLQHQAKLAQAGAVVAVAGMEGALPSVVGGLTGAPVIAVPTSVGYGASFGGLAPLLAMLNSCAAGVVVVNIDNGFGAGYFAALVAGRGVSRPREGAASVPVRRLRRGRDGGLKGSAGEAAPGRQRGGRRQRG